MKVKKNSLINDETIVINIEKTIFEFTDYIKGIFYNTSHKSEEKENFIECINSYFTEKFKKYFINLTYYINEDFNDYLYVKDDSGKISSEFDKNGKKIITSYDILKKMVGEIDQLLNEIYTKEKHSLLKMNASHINVHKSILNIQSIDDIYKKIIDIIENNLALFPLLLKEMVDINEFEVFKKYKLLGSLEKSIITRSLIDYDYYDFSHFFNNSVITNILINNEHFKVNSKEGMKKINIITDSLENKNMKNMEELVSKYQLDINDINNIYIVHLGEEKYNEVIEITFSEVC